MNARELAGKYRAAHNLMRNVDGLQPQEAFDELLKYLLFKQCNEDIGPQVAPPHSGRVGESLDKESKLIAGSIRRLFRRYLETTRPWSRELWSDRIFHLSDHALLGIHEQLGSIAFANVSFDIRGAALKTFMPGELRKGLGIYPTPDEVVRSMVRITSPKASWSVYDPACGTGTFLGEVLKEWARKSKSRKRRIIWGTDKSPRMLLLSALNLSHTQNVEFRHRLLDALFPDASGDEAADWPREGNFDLVLTNPPFGVALDRKTHDLRGFATCRTVQNDVVSRQQSEVVFIEQCLRYLRPGGTLGIVLPRSVVTNTGLEVPRKAIGGLGYVYAVIVLPPETFALASTQTSTVVLFMRRYASNERHDDKIGIAYCPIANVGFDTTGRARKGNQLPQAAEDITSGIVKKRNCGLCRILPPVAKNSSVTSLARLISGLHRNGSRATLKGVAELVRTGQTPARSSYAESGLFLVKVGNLSGNGINWAPRDRNFVGPSDAARRAKRPELILRVGDILLTSSAHSPVYIAKKVDIVSWIPEWIGPQVSYVGEVMLIRPKTGLVDPHVLLAYLRLPETTAAIRALVRGQTAHVHPRDMMELEITKNLKKPARQLLRLAGLLKREADLARAQNELAHERDTLVGAL